MKPAERITPLDPQTVFCPNPACPARGRVGEGNIGVHSQQKRRYKCNVCDKTFTETKGTPFYRLKVAKDLFTLVVTLLGHGCPVQAIVVAFGLDERTVKSWLARAGQQCQAVHEHVVQQPRDVGQVQMDEVRIKQQGAVVWMAMALWVRTRLWLGGRVAHQRDHHLITALVEKVRACASALGGAILFCTDGFRAYVSAIGQVFRQPIPTGQKGRPRLRPWDNICIAQVVKQVARRRVVGVVRRIIQGTAQQVDAVLQRSQGGGQIHVSYIERLNGTFRQRLAPLVRRTRALARQSQTLHWGMYLVGTIYNFCTEHQSLRLPGLIGGHKWLSRTPAMAAGLTDHCWSVHQLLSYHVPPPPWRPPKRRGRPSRATKLLIARWCS